MWFAPEVVTDVVDGLVEGKKSLADTPIGAGLETVGPPPPEAAS